MDLGQKVIQVCNSLGPRKIKTLAIGGALFVSGSSLYESLNEASHGHYFYATVMGICTITSAFIAGMHSQRKY